MSVVLITGNTFPVKDQIKALGGKWDPQARGWRVPEDKAKEAQALVDGAPAKKPSTAAASYRRRGWAPCGYPGCHPSYCDECDGEGRYGRGYR